MRYYLGGVALLTLFACAHSESAKAQQSTVVITCGTQSIPAGQGTSGTYIDATGNLCTNATGGGGGGGTSSNFGSAFPAAGTAAGFKDSTGTNMAAGNLTAGGAIKTDTTSVNGVTTSTGAGATGTGSLRTTQAQDTSTVAGAAPTTTGIYVTGPSAAALGTAANQTAIQATAGSDASKAVAVQGVTGAKAVGVSAASGAVASGAFAAGSVSDGGIVTLGSLADVASCTATNTAIACLRQIDADVKGTGTVQGTAASGSSVSGNPLLDGGRAATAAPTAVTDGQAVAKQMTPDGRTVVAPYAIKELMVRGTVTSTDTAAHTIIASAGGSLKNYITSLQCGRIDAGATAIVLTLSDAASTVIILPSGGATNIMFPIPLATAAATAFTVTSGTGVSTLYCSAQGFTGL